ncbi:MAG: PKD domain-containing protein, partial [Flavobacteriales bacterium]
MLYKWYFGNGDSSATKDPTLLYDTLGLYNVRLVARASDLGNPCSSQVVKQVPIHPIPDTKFSFSNNCDDDSIRFTNNTSIPDASAMTYRWNFNDAKGVQIIPNVSFKYNFDSPATRNVNLEVISNKNCTIQITKAVRFYALAFAKFDTSLASVCIYKTSAFANNSSMSNGGNLFYNWSFGDGDTSVIKDPSHRYNPSTPGFGIDQPFTVKLKVRPTDLTNVCRDS